MRRRQHLGWTFRLGTRWASGQLEGARRRAGTHPRLRQQGPEPARRGEQRQEEEQASGGAGSEAIDRQTRGCRLALSRQDFRCEDFRHRQDCRASSLAVCRLASHTMFEIGSDSCSYKKIRAFR